MMKTLEEVRVEIDRVDKEIKKLFIERMSLADNVARIKAETEDAIYKPERETIIIEKQSKDVKPELVMEYKALIRRIMEVSRKYQYGKTLELRKCFPFTFETKRRESKVPAMLRSELYFCDWYSKDDVICVESFQELSELIRDGKADSGIGILEEIGRSASEELNSMLADQNFYINRCAVKEDGEVKRKIVEFGKELLVEPDHNRLKVVFVCRNQSGSLGSLLSMISDYGVNLTEIHSRPYRCGEEWNYRFFLELNLNLLDEKSQALIFQLSSETQMFKILGSYFCEGDF